jgi:hypothetical protein
MRWEVEGVAKYISHTVLWNQITPEQQELLVIKCHKRDLHIADNTTMAISSALSGALKGKSFKPSDKLDIMLGQYSLETETDEPLFNKPLTPQQRRKLKYLDRWKWTERQLADWLIERQGNILHYFDLDELKSMGIDTERLGQHDASEQSSS